MQSYKNLDLKFNRNLEVLFKFNGKKLTGKLTLQNWRWNLH